jgi:poly(A) polymerase
MEWLFQTLGVLRKVRDRIDARVPVEETAEAVKQPKKNQSSKPRIAPIGPARAPVPEAPPPPPPPAREPRRVREREREREPRETRDRDAATQQIPLELIDPHALEVTRRLRRFGHRAYLVGGCVRDLLLGLKPKDFDVTTSAKPEEVKSIFRNSRIIGRRFRLVHVFFRGGKIIEVSTFRANASAVEEEGDETPDLLIRRDNVFGTEEEDALRRDFRINGMFYDTGTGRIIDHVGGLADVETKMMRMIGDPEVRLREDPIRILRAIRISVKTGLTIDPELMRSMMRHKQDISRCAPARVLEETLRLLRIGHAEKIVRMMEETGILEFLVPEIYGYVDWPRDQEDEDGPREPPRLFPGQTSRQLFYAHLGALDRMIAHGPVSDAVVIGALLYAPVVDLQVEAEREKRDKNRATAEFLVTISARLMLTRRISEHLRQIFIAQRHFLKPVDGKKRRSPVSISKRTFYPDALALFEVHAAAMGLPANDLERPSKPINGSAIDAMDDGGVDAPRKRARRRRGGRGRRTEDAEPTR